MSSMLCSMDCERFRLTLGGVLRERRSGLGLSQEDFAAELGLHRTYIGSVERGERNCGIDNLRRIAEALGVRLSELIREAEGRNARSRR